MGEGEGGRKSGGGSGVEADFVREMREEFDGCDASAWQTGL